MYIFCRPALQVSRTDLNEVGGKAPTDFNKTGLGQHSENLIHSDLLFAAWLTLILLSLKTLLLLTEFKKIHALLKF